MNNQINIAILGLKGRMGKAIIDLINEYNALGNPNQATIKVAFGLETSNRANSTSSSNPPIYSTLEEVGDELFNDLTAIVDFSSPQGTLTTLRASLKKNLNIPFIIGTTGFSKEEENYLLELSNNFPLVVSGNFSLGINVLIKLIKNSLPLLAGMYDVEIVEHHHNQKKDAPSGTATMLLQAVQEVGDFSSYAVVTERKGQVGKRGRKEIGIFALRGGGVIGEHKIYFFSENDKIELTHTAFNRKAFTSGVLRAIEFLVSEKPKMGLFKLPDILKR